MVDQLNDPGNSPLLITKWSAGQWQLTTANDLTNCRISNNSAGQVDRSEIISQTRNAGSAQIRYRLTNLRPPVYPANLPTAICTNTESRDKFGNIAGGTTRLTITGEVLRNGRTIASHQLVREVIVDPEIDNSPTATAVSPPIAFLATGTGASTFVSVENSSDIITRLAIDSGTNLWQYDNNDAQMTVFCLGMDASTCRNQSSSLNSSFLVSGYSLAEYSALFPTKPPTPSDLLDNAAWPKVDHDKPNADIYYPYTTQNGTTDLRSNCRKVTLPSQNGEPEQVIACKIGTLILEGSSPVAGVRRLVVNTLPVDNITNKPIPVALYVFNKLELKNAVIQNRRFAETRNQAGQAKSWNTLRIYGDPTFAISMNTNLNQCDNAPNKTTWKLEDSSQIDGAFVWAPIANIEFKEPRAAAASAYSLYGALWSCKSKFEKDVKFLTTSASDTSQAIDDLFGLGTLRFRTRGTR